MMCYYIYVFQLLQKILLETCIKQCLHMNDVLFTVRLCYETREFEEFL